MNKKYVIYTSLTAGYDALPQYEVLHPDFDYICFSNDFPAYEKIGHWTIKPIPIKSNSKIMLTRFPKLCPHNVLKEYQYSIWLDSNLIINSFRLYEVILNKIREGGIWYGIKHPVFDCIYDDATKCLLTAKAKYKEIKPQIEFLKSEQFPHHFGLFENNMIIRCHNNPIAIKIDELWWWVFNKYSHRDQLGLFYIFWKHNFAPQLIFNDGENTHNSELIKFKPHNPLKLRKRIQNKLIRWQNIILMTIDKYFINER